MLEEQVVRYEEAVGRKFEFPAIPPLPVNTQDNQAQEQQRMFRIHAADIQLTYNGSWLPPNELASSWFERQGVRLVAAFQTWTLDHLPTVVQQRLKHVSLTLEESLHSTLGTRVHLHAQLTFATRIDRTSTNDFVFQGVRPHVVSWLAQLAQDVSGTALQTVQR